jgi:hypothetical protein
MAQMASGHPTMNGISLQWALENPHKDYSHPPGAGFIWPAGWTGWEIPGGSFHDLSFTLWLCNKIAIEAMAI